MDEETVKVTGLIPPLKDTLHSQKKKIQAVLKSERNRIRLKTLLKECKWFEKNLKNLFENWYSSVLSSLWVSVFCSK